MKDSINKIYNAIINYIIDFFHVFKKRFNKFKRKTKLKLRKLYYYEILGVIAVSVYFYRFLCKIYKMPIFKKFRNKSKLLYKKSLVKLEKAKYDYETYLLEIRYDTKDKMDNVKNKYSKYCTKRILAKSFVLIALSVFLIYDTYSWFYNEYVSKGTKISLGTVEHIVNQYDKNGNLIGIEGDIVTVVEEDNLANTFKNTRYVEIKNTGSLNLDYNLTFTLDGTMSNAGVLYYRVIDITEDVINTTITSGSNTKLEAYAKNNPTPNNLETDAVNPVSNMTTIPQVLIKGEIDKDEDNLENNYRYFRIDYGMYQSVNSALYSGASVAVHAKVYCTQRGIDASLINE